MKNIISKFYVCKANYSVFDKNGIRVCLFLNYKMNTYKIRFGNSNNDIDLEFRKQIVAIAEDLLSRKAGINLVNNLKQKGTLK